MEMLHTLLDLPCLTAALHLQLRWTLLQPTCLTSASPSPAKLPPVPHRAQLLPSAPTKGSPS